MINVDIRGFRVVQQKELTKYIMMTKCDAGRMMTIQMIKSQEDLNLMLEFILCGNYCQVDPNETSSPIDSQVWYPDYE